MLLFFLTQELAKFLILNSVCWLPFKNKIPVLLQHDLGVGLLKAMFGNESTWFKSCMSVLELEV